MDANTQPAIDRAGRVLRPNRREILQAALGCTAVGLAGCGVREDSLSVTPLPAAAVNVRRSADRGHANHGWLDTYHTFSFAGYSDPEFTQFGPLRVLNQDRVTGGGGFPMHGHRDMEIVSFVLEGEMAHRDTMGNGSIIRPGDVQLMSAGHGVRHSEFNASDSAGLHFLQMWVLPAERSTEPRYEQRAFTRESRENRLRLVVSPQGEEGSLTIGQDASLYTALLAESRTLEHRLEPGRAAWLHLASGDLRVNGQELEAGDGAAIVNPSSSSPSRVDFLGRADAEFVLWDVPV